MNTEQQAQQLRLAADIIETGHPWEYQPDHYNWKLSQGHCPLFAIGQRVPIRLALAVPPDGRALHNPDNLTAEQVGAGFRLALPNEKLDRNYEYWLCMGGWKTGHGQGPANGLNPGASMRLPLSVPWPEAEKPDPYADLKAAHAAGKVVQVRSPLTGMEWVDCDIEPEYGIAKGEEYRIKPEPASQLPPAPPGMRWHREDGWEEGDLPQGWRPLVDGERSPPTDEIKRRGKWETLDAPSDIPGLPARIGTCHCRTRRHLTFEHAGKTWTWHRPGDPMPCDGERVIQMMYQDGQVVKMIDPAIVGWARNEGCSSDIIGWRYAVEKKVVPLGPEDVPPGSVFRPIGWSNMPNMHVNYEAVVTNGVRTIGREWGEFCSEHGYLCWAELQSDWQINRSIPLTGKWDANAWELCSKEVAV